MAGPSDDYPDLQGANDHDAYEAFLDGYSSQFAVHEGEILYGHVLKVSDTEVIVDIGRKIEGLVPAAQFPSLEGKPSVHPGDVIEVMLDRVGEPVQGYILLSYERAHRRHVWEELERTAAEAKPVRGRIVSKIKGGLAIDIGVIAFLPSSQVDLKPVHNLEPYIGQELEVRILKLNRRRGNAVVSHRVLVEQDLLSRKAAVLASLCEGAEVSGVVKNLTAYGAFVDLGGIDGLLHIGDLSYGNISHPSEVVQVGDRITAKVLKFDPAKERISLGLKQMYPDPWLNVATRYPPQSHVSGRVVSVTDYGAFVELEPGVEGLIHISEMTWSRRVKHPAKMVSVGDTIESVVLDVRQKERRISLGLKQLEADPWTTVAERYSVGSVVEGRVRKLADFGAFVEIEEGVDGLVHISDLSWTARVKHPSEMVRKGQILQAVVLNIDAPNRRLSLGVKQLQPDAWETFFRTHEVGDILRGRVSRAAEFGVFVELAPGIEGLCHRSEIGGGKRRAKLSGAAEPILTVGQDFEFKVIRLNEAQKRIGLSLRAVAEADERNRLQNYKRQAAVATSSVGEALKERKAGESR
ncbi:MAG TPA: 30S ribosomal protein S1 [Bryobacteraceae bacterium]